jgi:hypothetical protein
MSTVSASAKLGIHVVTMTVTRAASAARGCMASALKKVIPLLLIICSDDGLWADVGEGVDPAASRTIGHIVAALGHLVKVQWRAAATQRRQW